MRHTGLIGASTEHSISNQLYPQLARSAGLLEEYEHIRFDVEESNLQRNMRSMMALGFLGVNITIPYKLRVTPYLDHLDEEAKVIGAVNTIRFGSSLSGHNTDWRGIVNALAFVGRASRAQTATIIGSGGAARAAIFACRRIGASKINVVFRSRRSKNTLSLSQSAQASDIRLLEHSALADAVEESDLVINASSGGMLNASRLDLSPLFQASVELRGKVALDVVANPIDTPFLTYCAGNGAEAVDGLWMMIYQCIAAMSIWFDSDIAVPDSELRLIHASLAPSISVGPNLSAR